MRFRAKEGFEAHRWHKLGDHPKDGGADEPKVVKRWFVTLETNQELCLICRRPMHMHGRIENKYGDLSVCPGDWIIAGSSGNHRPCNPAIFDELYEVVRDE